MIGTIYKSAWRLLRLRLVSMPGCGHRVQETRVTGFQFYFNHSLYQGVRMSRHISLNWRSHKRISGNYVHLTFYILCRAHFCNWFYVFQTNFLVYLFRSSELWTQHLKIITVKPWKRSIYSQQILNVWNVWVTKSLRHPVSLF